MKYQKDSLVRLGLLENNINGRVYLEHMMLDFKKF
jgi:hypothetical protein